MQSCIRRRDRVAAVAHYRRQEEMLWRELEFLLSQQMCLLYEMAMHGGWNLHEESSLKGWQPTSIRGAVPASGRRFCLLNRWPVVGRR